MDAYIAKFEITAKETSLSTYVEQLPNEYQAFMVAKKVAGRSEGTLKQYAFHLVPFFYHTGKLVKEIKEEDIILYLYALSKTRKNISNRYIEHIRLILASFFGWCHDNGYIDKNPMSVIEPIKYEKKEFHPIEDESFERIRQSITDVRDKAIFETMYSSGCRVGELVKLKLSDVDVSSREVKLFGKGQKHRTSFVSTRAIIALKDYLKIRPDTDCEYLFVSHKKPHGVLKSGTVRVILTKYGIDTSIDIGGNLHPHRLRHQFASDWVNKGLPVTELQQLLGHSNLRTTQEYYELSKAKTKYDYMNFIA